MKIGIDIRAVSGMAAGKGQLARALVNAMIGLGGRTASLVMYSDQDENTVRRYLPAWSDQNSVHLETTRLRGLSWHRNIAKRSATEVDIFYSPTSYIIPAISRGKTAMTVHDLIAFHPELPRKRKAVIIERLMLGRAARRTSAITCISEATAKDLISRFPASKLKVHVVYPGPGQILKNGGANSTPAIWPFPGDDRPYFLFVGTLEGRKNLARIIEAHQVLLKEISGIGPRLVLVGQWGWNSNDIRAAIERAVPGSVEVLGYQSDDALRMLYKRALAFIFPSLYEGFGLILLEAMQLGCPVMTSRTSSLPEVAGDAAIYVDPFDVRDISRSMKRLLQDEPLRNDLAKKGLVNVQRFSWEKAALQTLEIISAAATEDSRGVVSGVKV